MNNAEAVYKSKIAAKKMAIRRAKIEERKLLRRAMMTRAEPIKEISPYIFTSVLMLSAFVCHIIYLLANKDDLSQARHTPQTTVIQESYGLPQSYAEGVIGRCYDPEGRPIVIYSGQDPKKFCQ